MVRGAVITSRRNTENVGEANVREGGLWRERRGEERREKKRRVEVGERREREHYGSSEDKGVEGGRVRRRDPRGRTASRGSRPAPKMRGVWASVTPPGAALPG